MHVSGKSCNSDKSTLKKYICLPSSKTYLAGCASCGPAHISGSEMFAFMCKLMAFSCSTTRCVSATHFACKTNVQEDVFRTQNYGRTKIEYGAPYHRLFHLAGDNSATLLQQSILRYVNGRKQLRKSTIPSAVERGRNNRYTESGGNNHHHTMGRTLKLHIYAHVKLATSFEFDVLGSLLYISAVLKLLMEIRFL